MATHYSGIGDTSMENPETHNMDNDRIIFKKKILFNN